MARSKRLGRGLKALLGEQVKPADEQPADSGTLQELSLDQLQKGRYQPRRDIPEAALKELAESIRAQGVIQPLVVRPVRELPGQYEIVAGERRWRAARLAKLDTVPVVVRETSDQEALAIALIENLQREDLNPIEQAEALNRLCTEFSLTHQEVADAIGRSRPSVTNLMRLLELDPAVKEMLAAGTLEMGHGRALLSLDPVEQRRLAERASAQGLSVREVERLVKGDQGAPAKKQAKAGESLDSETRWFQQLIVREVGRDVSIRPMKSGRRKLDISFDSLEQLQAALVQIGELINRLRETAGPRVRETKGATEPSDAS